MAETVHLSFSIGPVQGFVAQARRTRDLWAGSWLLSYLSECALAAAESDELAGETIIPHRADHDRGQISSKQTAVGGIPNRFEMRFSGPDAGDRAKAAAAVANGAFVAAWQHVARVVWEKCVEPVAAHGHHTRGIWDRQVNSLWELSWVVGEPEDYGTINRLAAMRKSFRNVNSDVRGEAGTKCSLMPSLQEISGHSGPERDMFWQALRHRLSDLDLGRTERLCSIALIKRLLPSVVKHVVGGGTSAQLNQVAWPSTAFMAAIPWLKNLPAEAQKVAGEYMQLAIASGYKRSEHQAARDAGIDWAEADGPIWFASAVRNDEPGRAQLDDHPSDEQKRRRNVEVKGLLEALCAVYRKAGEGRSSEPSSPIPYYSVLLMDGDSMGQLVGQLGSPRGLSKCLGEFSVGVNKVVEAHSGRTVYAGGDDVLALVPSKFVLNAAEELCDRYRAAFSSTPAKDSATISAAVVYAHWRYPLRQVLRTAHRLLDDVAKNETGRDSIAIGVIPGSGLSAVWSVPWSVLRGQTQGTTALQELVAAHFGSNVQNEKAEFNASYLYLLRARFGRLFADSHDHPGEFSRIPFAAELLTDLAHSEYRRRMSASNRQAKDRADTEPLIDQLMSLSRQWKRNNAGVPDCDRETFTFDGWRVARFLRQIQDGKGSDHD